MKVNEQFFISSRREDDAIITNILSVNGQTEELLSGSTKYTCANNILKACRKRTSTTQHKNDVIKKMLRICGLTDSEIELRIFTDDNPMPDSTPSVAKFDKHIAINAIDKLIKFFTEFNFTPSFRFVNSLSISKNPREYVRNYFAVQDHPYINEITDKIKSVEFKEILNLLKQSNCTPKPINTRFELYYGEPGTGKTTKAMTMTDKCIICSSDMLPADLMQNFVFKDGKADFDPSDLWKAMENGTSIVLDEVNMLPFESLRFLQGITDGKETFNYKGHEIKIHPDFKIYATMNLNVNGQCIPLPAPLVDRSYQIVEFSITAAALVSALAS